MTYVLRYYGWCILHLRLGLIRQYYRAQRGLFGWGYLMGRRRWNGTPYMGTKRR